MKRCSSRSASTISRSFARKPARLDAVAALDQQLGDLLRDRRAAFDDAAFDEVVARRADQRHGIDAGMRVEAPILSRDRRRDEDRRQRVRLERPDPRPFADSASYSTRAVPIDHDRRRRVDAVEQRRRERRQRIQSQQRASATHDAPPQRVDRTVAQHPQHPSRPSAPAPLAPLRTY